MERPPGVLRRSKDVSTLRFLERYTTILHPMKLISKRISYAPKKFSICNVYPVGREVLLRLVGKVGAPERG